MKEKILYGLAGFVIGIAATWLITSSTPGVNKGMMYRNTSRQTSDMLDAHFIEQMIPHHEDAITMSKLAQTKAERPEVKKLADTIISSQGKEITQMKTWYKDWFGKEVMQHHGMMSNTSEMHMGMMGSDDDLYRLKNADDFDVAFLEHMIPHHQMAVMMASMLKDGTQRPEMKKLADDIITSQTNEIDQMRTWLDERKSDDENQ
jgi:uncharacterized protein (DUF305 family)